MEAIQRRIIRPQKLIHVEPFRVVVLWSNGEIRSNDFTAKVEQWKNGRNKHLAKLAKPEVFLSATIHENALAFKRIRLVVPGIPGTQPLDLDPDVMFEESIKLGKSISGTKPLPIPKARIIKSRTPVQINSSAQGFDLTVGSQSFHFTSARPLIRVGDELIELEN
jgi:hypothetical protein